MQIIEHEKLDIPHGNNIIWRYMGLDKFLDLIVNDRLFFGNADKLTDDYEVSLPKSLIERKKIELKKWGYSKRDIEEELAIYQAS